MISYIPGTKVGLVSVLTPIVTFPQPSIPSSCREEVGTVSSLSPGTRDGIQVQRRV